MHAKKQNKKVHANRVEQKNKVCKSLLLGTLGNEDQDWLSRFLTGLEESEPLKNRGAKSGISKEGKWSEPKQRRKV